MKTVIICGSHRLNTESQGMKVARLIERKLQKKGTSVSIIDLSHNQLPLWDEGMWVDDPKWKTIWGPLEKQLREADSLVVVTPEYNGMAAPALKNFFLFCTGDIIAHKPALLVAVSAGAGGHYPIQELRGSGYKNSKLLYIPDHLIVMKAETLLNTDTPAAGSVDEIVQKRFDYALGVLAAYSNAMKPVRESGIFNYKEYLNGL